MTRMNDEALVSLDDGDFEVAEGQPDVRGWDVVTADQQRIGEVEDLLADPEALKVRYLAIDMDASATGAGSADRIVRVPIARARLMEHERKVVLDVTVANMANFNGADRSFETDDRSFQTADRNVETAEQHSAAQDHVRLTRAAEELRIGKRQVQAGEVEVKKTVETEHVRQPVTLRTEEVDIERRPVTSGTVSGDVQISAEEIRIPVTEEQAVVEKRPVVKEEIVITKRSSETQQTVEADVRSERVDVERHGDVNTHDSRDRKR